MSEFSPIGISTAFGFGPNFSFSTTNVMCSENQNYLPPFPVPDLFLLLDNSDFLLLDGTDFLLLGS